jgi:hypothetical protein
VFPLKLDHKEGPGDTERIGNDLIHGTIKGAFCQGRRGQRRTYVAKPRRRKAESGPACVKGLPTKTKTNLRGLLVRPLLSTVSRIRQGRPILL